MGQPLTKDDTASGRGSWRAAIRSPEDVQRVLALVEQQGGERDRTAELTAGLRRIVTPASQLPTAETDSTSVLPVAEELRGLLPGLRRGSVVAAPDSMSLVFALIAGVMTEPDAWAAMIGQPDAGLAAAQSTGVDLARLALVPYPGEHWATVTGICLEGMNLVITNPPEGVPAAVARSLQAKARQSGSVLISRRPWPGAEFELSVTGRRYWTRGRIRKVEYRVAAFDRRRPRPRHDVVEIPLPSLRTYADPYSLPAGMPEPAWGSPASAVPAAARRTA